MKTYKNRYEVFIYLSSDFDKQTVTDLIHNRLDYDNYLNVFIQNMHKQRDRQFYRKIGNKYIPLRSEYETTGLSDGYYLLRIRPGVVSYRSLIAKPAWPELEAACVDMEDELARQITEAQSARPRNAPVSLKEKRAWRAYHKIMGTDPRTGIVTLMTESSFDTAQKVVNFLRQKIYQKKHLQ